MANDLHMFQLATSLKPIVVYRFGPGFIQIGMEDRPLNDWS